MTNSAESERNAQKSPRSRRVGRKARAPGRILAFALPILAVAAGALFLITRAGDRESRVDIGVSQTSATRESRGESVHLTFPEEPASRRVADVDPEKSATLEIEAISVSTQRPVPWVHFRVAPLASGTNSTGNSAAPSKAFTTNTAADGRAVCPGLAPGVWMVCSNRGGVERAELKTGATTQLKYYLSGNVDVEGIVISSAGEPIAGASIWLSAPEGREGGSIAAETASNGTFLLEFVDSKSAVAAFAPGFAMSPQYSASDGKSKRTRLTIVLDAAGGRVEGRVTDASGRPIAGATVKIATTESLMYETNPQRIVKSAPARELLTDRDGMYRAIGVPAGFLRVEAAAADVPSQLEFTQLDAGGVATVNLILTPGWTLSGTVRNELSMPVENAQIRVEPVAHARRAAFRLRSASHSDGRFELKNLPRESLEILVTKHSKDTIGRSFFLLNPPPGASLEYDILITSFGSVRGLVQDSSGVPVANVVVSLMKDIAFESMLSIENALKPETRVIQPSAVRTGSDGMFEITSVPMSRYTLAAVGFDAAGHTHEGSVVRVSPVFPGGEILNITVPAIPEQNAQIRGRFVDPAGAPLGSAIVHIYGETIVDVNALEAGRFDTGLVAPGMYTIDCEAGGAHWRANIALAAGEMRNLGDVRVDETGIFILEFSAESNGGEAKGPPIHAREVAVMPAGESNNYPSNSMRVEARDEPGSIRIPGIAPGDWILRAAPSQSSFLYIHIPFHIDAKRETRVVFTPRPGSRRIVRFYSFEGAPALSRLDVRLVDAAGTVVAAGVLRPDDSNEFLKWPLTLPSGEYQLSAASPDGRAAQTPIKIRQSTMSSGTVDIWVK